MYTSDESGNGKTFEIFRQIKDEEYDCFNLSPYLKDSKLIERLTRIFKPGYVEKIKHIIFKVEAIDFKSDIEVYRLNKFLFNFSCFKMIQILDIVYYFPKNIKIHVEISNNFKNRLFKILDSINCNEIKYCKFNLQNIEIGKKFYYKFQKFSNYISLFTEFQNNKSEIIDADQINKLFIETKFKIYGKKEILELLDQNVIQKINSENESFELQKKYYPVLQYIKKNKTNSNFLFPKISLTYRSLEQYIDFVNKEFDLFYSKNRKTNTIPQLHNLLIEIFEFYFVIVFCLPNGKTCQNLAENLKHLYLKYEKKFSFFTKSMESICSSKQGKEIRKKKQSIRIKIEEIQKTIKLKKQVIKKHDNMPLLVKKNNTIDMRENTKKFENEKGFVLTPDNYKKIIIIDKKLKSGNPLIIMGETGCGKTFLLEYYAKVFLKDSNTFFKYVLHQGVTEQEFSKKIEEYIKVAKSIKNKNIFVFFDEINTSNLQTLISEIMIDRIYSFGSDKCNLFIFAFCNWSRSEASG